MQSRKLAIVATIAITTLLLAVPAVSTMTPRSVSAYEKNQATSQTSACGYEFIPINIGCQNTDSQIQGDENAAALTAQQTFPEVKLVQEKPPKPTPMTATLQVCKDVDSSDGTYDFGVTGNNPSPEQFSLMPGECQDVTMGPGDYVVTEEFEGPEYRLVSVRGDTCTQTQHEPIASGNIQAGETQNCFFLNGKAGCEADTVWDLTLDEEVGSHPIGEELCSSNGLGLQEVKIANGPLAGHFFDVDIHELPCGPIPDALAHASSGTPPDPLVINDPICVDFDPDI